MVYLVDGCGWFEIAVKASCDVFETDFETDEKKMLFEGIRKLGD